MTLFAQSNRPLGCAAATMLAMVLVQVCSSSARGQQSDAPPAIVAQEAKAALEVARKQLSEDKGKVTKLEARNKALAESLAESNRVFESMRAEHEELLLRMASFGVDLLKPDPKSLEQRLLNAVRERDLVEQEREKLARQLLRLSEVAVSFMQTAVSPDAASLELIESEVRAANDVLGFATAPVRETSRTLTEGRVVSIDPAIGLVVLNVGKKSGVRVGMPLRILRSETVIATAMVVDVRDSIAGAVLQKIAAEGGDVKVGDSIQQEARQL
jgi:hypothetical protein